MNLRIELNEPKIREKVTSDRFGMFVSKSWKTYLNRFTPQRNGLLIRNVSYKPFQIHYKQEYSGYMYDGIIWVDPIYNCSGFMTDEGWKSRKGVKKIPSGRTFTYNKSTSKNATDHWDIVAAQSGELNKLYRTLNNALQSGQF